LDISNEIPEDREKRQKDAPFGAREWDILCIDIYIYVSDMQKTVSRHKLFKRNRDSEILKNASENIERGLVAPFEGR